MLKRSVESKANNPVKRCKYVEKGTNAIESSSIFNSTICHILSAHFGLGRLRLFKNHIVKNGGQLVENITHQSKLTHIIVEETVPFEKVSRLVGEDHLQDATVVKCTWISACIKSRCCIDMVPYRLEQKGVAQTKIYHTDVVPENKETISDEGISAQMYTTAVEASCASADEASNYTQNFSPGKLQVKIY